MRIARAVVRRMRRLRVALIDLLPGGPGRASRRAEQDLTARILAQLPEPAPATGPRVAVVILNRNGVGHLRRLLPALESTAYADFETILVDNASSDGSVAYARGFRSRRPLRIVENAENLSFSAANNAALEHTDAELLLFLNNDVRPMEPHWLSWMVESVMTAGTSACGVRMVLPRRSIPRSERTGMQGDLELLHTGMEFVSIDGMPRPRTVGGPDPTGPGLAAVREQPLAAAACLLIPRDAFMAVGGFDPAYVYGYEDVDLCLRLRAAGGRILVDGRAVLWHDEGSTRRRDLSKAARVQQRENRHLFYARWGRTLFRDVLRDRLDDRRLLSIEPLSFGIAVPAEAVAAGGAPPEALDLRDALARRGWAVELLVAGGIGWPGTVEVVVASDPSIDVRQLPRHVLKIALIVGPAGPWLAAPWIDDFDLLLVGDKGTLAAIRRGTSHIPRPAPPAGIADAIVTELRSWIEARRAGILIDGDGSEPVARRIQREFERRGLPSTIYFPAARHAAVSTRDDLLIHLSDGEPLRRRPGQASVLWVADQEQPLADEQVASYDIVLVASDHASDADRVDEILRQVDDLQPGGRA